MDELSQPVLSQAPRNEHDHDQLCLAVPWRYVDAQALSLVLVAAHQCVYYLVVVVVPLELEAILYPEEITNELAEVAF